ncbi:MAG: hypothetical protein AAB884_00440 [Patescibacteria group bacterium]
MFRSIGSRVDKVKKNLAQADQAGNKLDRAFARFLAEYFPEGKGWGFKADILNNKVMIQTSNKTIANELILRIRELSAVLKEEKLNFDQIIIR